MNPLAVVVFAFYLLAVRSYEWVKYALHFGPKPEPEDFS